MRKEDQAKARAMRERGLSIRSISKTLGISKGSISPWVKDVALTISQREALKKNNSIQGAVIAIASEARKRREQWQEQGREEARKKVIEHAMGCMLYWAEGSKRANVVRMTNTDGEIIKYFIKFLKRFYCVADMEIKIVLHCYSGNGKTPEEAQDYWMNFLNLPRACLQKTYLDYDKRIRTGKKKNRHVNGICSMTVCKTEIVQRIFGSIQEYSGFDRPEWSRSGTKK